jgi:1-phosphofructokinase family hexose kinase
MPKRPEYDLVFAAPNPAVDSYYVLDELKLAGVNAAQRAFHTAGGKGNNLARAAVRLQGKALSLGIAGGDAGRFIQSALQKEAIDNKLVWTGCETRRNITLYAPGEPDTTVIIEPGEAAGKEVQQAFFDLVLSEAPRGNCLVLTGSLQPGFSSRFYADLVRRLKDAVKICLDCAGEALKQAAQAGAQLIKVNWTEYCLAFCRDGEPFDLAHLSGTFAELGEFGTEVLVVTDGANGAFIYSRSSSPLHVRTEVGRWVSTAGSGDTFLAGLLLGLLRGHSIEQAAAFASAAAAANLQELGCGFFDPGEVERFLAATNVKVLTGE